jgi:hypothetical protein
VMTLLTESRWIQDKITTKISIMYLVTKIPNEKRS